MNILNTLIHQQLKLSKSELQIREIILSDPSAITSMTIAQLAQSSSVSEPTVNRFCHKFDCSGYPDFKLKIAAELAIETPRMNQAVEPNDPTNEVIGKIFSSNHSALHLCEKECNPDDIDAAANLIMNAKALYFFGNGASASVALDAQQKFMRFDTPVIVENDYLNQRMLAAGMSKDSVAICISHTGRTKSMISVAQEAVDANAKLIGITANDSPLAKLCNQVIHVAAREDTELYTPMTSRISHLVMLDIVASTVAIKMGENFSDRLKRIKQSIADTKI